MSISGSLEDVAVGDVLQFIHLGKRTGTLELERDGEQARFGFKEGALVAARAPGRRASASCSSSAVTSTPRRSTRRWHGRSAGTPRRSLGRLLVDEGLLRREELESVVRLQLELAVEQVFRWERGSFDFALDEIRPIDEIGTEAFDLESDSGLASNVVLLEAARIFDERDRLGVSKSLGEASDDAFDGLIDEEVGTFAGPVVRRALAGSRVHPAAAAGTRRPGDAAAGHARAGRPTPPTRGDSDILLIDARADALDAELLGTLREARPDAGWWCWSTRTPPCRSPTVTARSPRCPPSSRRCRPAW